MAATAPAWRSGGGGQRAGGGPPAEQTHSVGYLGRKLATLQERIQPLPDRRMTELNDRIDRLLATT
jgi:hypothetical protein